MASTSPDELAGELLKHCLLREAVPDEVLAELAEQALSTDESVAALASRALFGGLVEPLADRFEPDLCDAYVALFSRLVERAYPAWTAGDLIARYQRIRRARRYADLPEVPKRVLVLSRVTLGADVAITSVILDAVKKRFPDAEIYFVGGRKGWELFEEDERILHLPLAYGRSDTFAQRIEAGVRLADAIEQHPGLVVDPDSRLTQLGLLPVCDEADYSFLESRARGTSGESLTRLTERWVAETFGVEDATPYIAPADLTDPTSRPVVTVSFGVGDNLDKRVPDPFEAGLLRELTSRGLEVVLDCGAGGEEAARVERAIAGLGGKADLVTTFSGAFAAFAARIAHSRLYIGYDSAGQHVAATCGVPLVTVFSGFASERMFARWQPTGIGPSKVLRVDKQPPRDVLATVVSAVDALLRDASKE